LVVKLYVAELKISIKITNISTAHNLTKNTIEKNIDISNPTVDQILSVIHFSLNSCKL